MLETTGESALEAGVVAGEAVEDTVEAGVEERVAGLGFDVLEAADAAEVPGGEEELLEQVLFELADGAELLGIGVEQLLELGAVLGFDVGVAGGEAVFEAVFGRDSLAFRGGGTGGKLGAVLAASWAGDSMVIRSLIQTIKKAAPFWSRLG